MKVRTITAGLTLDAECSQLPETIERLREAQATFENAGYEVQTTRVATQPIDELAGSSVAVLHDVAGGIHEICVAQDFQFVSLG
ncbi:MAG: DUF711 family protein, partial [Chloroflexi bacterium]